MNYLPYSGSITAFPGALRYAQRALIAAILVSLAALSWSQNSPASQTQPSPSLAGPLKRAKTENTQLHILYVHGMGAAGPGVSASLDLRKSICAFLRDCAKPEGEFDGTDYADRGAFALDAPPPNLKYLGQPLWKTVAGGASEEWNASTPYVDHYKLVRNGNAPTIYLDEINWWPLVFAAKCRQIIGEDAALTGPNKTYIHTCSLPATPDPNHQKNPGRFRTYPFLTNQAELLALPPKGALLNRALKSFVLDWGFADAVLAVGPMRRLFLEGIGQIVLKSVKVSADGSRGDSVIPASNQEFVIVSHSLGSYLMFSALDIPADPGASPPQWRADFDYVLRNTSKTYFLANQVTLLELANLDVTGNANLITHLKAWSDLRRAARKPVPQIVAWSDPSDLLTWTVSALDPEIALVNNQPVKNARHWFWLLENPSKAHTTYDQNKRVIQAMLPKKERDQ